MENLATRDQVLLVYAQEDTYAMIAFQELLAQEGVHVRGINPRAQGVEANLNAKALRQDGLLVVVLWSANWPQAGPVTAVAQALQHRREQPHVPSIIIFLLDESTPDSQIVPPGYAARSWNYSYLQSVQHICTQLAAVGWERPTTPAAPNAPPTTGIHQHIEGSRNIVAGRDVNSGSPLKP